MFETICSLIGSDADYDDRVRRLDIYRRVLGDVVRDSALNAVMLEAARTGSVGSVAVVIAHPGCATVSLIDAVARALRRSPRTERPLTLAVLTTERKAA